MKLDILQWFCQGITIVFSGIGSPSFSTRAIRFHEYLALLRDYKGRIEAHSQLVPTHLNQFKKDEGNE
jgi:hypothetical protein